MKKKTINIFLAIIAVFCLSVTCRYMYLLFDYVEGLQNYPITVVIRNAIIEHTIFSVFGLACTAFCVLMLIQTNRKNIEAVLQRRTEQKQVSKQAKIQKRKTLRIVKLEKELNNLKEDDKQ